MNEEIKVGDRVVRCGGFDDPDSGIYLNKEYIVDAVTFYDIRLKGHSGLWNTVYFKKVVRESPVVADPEVTIRQSEYNSLVDEINMLRELVADMNNLLEEKLKEETPIFKPISEMTFSDWSQAVKEVWQFETESQGIVTINANYADALSLSSPRLSHQWYVDEDGYDECNEGWTIINRVK